MDEGDGGDFCASCKISVFNTNCTTALSFFFQVDHSRCIIIIQGCQIDKYF